MLRCHIRFLRHCRAHSIFRAPKRTSIGELGGKKREKQTARKRKKQNLAGMDFQGLMDLREQVEDALSGYRSTLEEQLASIGGSVAAFGGKVIRGMRGSAMKGRKVAAKYKGPEWRAMGRSRCHAKMAGCRHERDRQEARRFSHRSGGGTCQGEAQNEEVSGRRFLYAFDLLELNGAGLRREPIEVRKAT